MKVWLKKPFLKWAGLLLIAAISYGGYRLYKELTMPPPLVFLIPDSYFGPVFIFFSQPDGIDSQIDPLGQAVRVPENGVIKARFSTKDIPFGDASPTYRPVYYISISKNGQRKILTVSAGTSRNQDGSFFDAYLNEKNQIHKFTLQNNDKKDKRAFSYFSESLRNERMIFNRDGCSHQGFSRNADKALGPVVEMSKEAAGIPACDKFLVISPNEYVNLPEWIWEDTQRGYSSIQEFVDEANERAKKKQEYYKLPGLTHSNTLPTQPAAAANPQQRGLPNEVVPQTGYWWTPSMQGAQGFHLFKQGDRFPAVVNTTYGQVIWYFDPDRQTLPKPSLN